MDQQLYNNLTLIAQREALKLELYKHPIDTDSLILHRYCQLILGNHNFEMARFFFLNEQQYVINDYLLSIGNRNKVLIDLRDILQICRHKLCHHVIFAHNHPEGNLKPSVQDIDLAFYLTDQLRQVNCNLLGCLIVTEYATQVFYRSCDIDALTLDYR